MHSRFKNLRLRFIVEGEGEGGGSEPQVDSTLDIPSTEGQPESGNPAWESLRSKLDPISFRSIEGDLKAWDTQASQRVASVNEQYKPWKQFADAGLEPDAVQQAVTIAQTLNEKPEEIYTALGTFLERENRLPNKQELKAEVAENNDEDSEGAPTDPRVAALEQQQAQMMQYFQNQQYAETERQAEQAIDGEINQLKQSHPELAQADVQEIIRRAALMAQTNYAAGNKKVPTLEEAFSDFSALRTRILSTPRPGDSAPQLIPTSGGVPSAGQQRTLGSLSRTETQDLIAGMIEQNRT